MFDHVDRTPDDRRDATVAATALAAERGADIVRVHDVAENRAAVDVQRAVDGQETDDVQRAVDSQETDDDPSRE